MPRPKLLFINRSYWPDTEATGQLLTELCEDLASEFDITVICGQPREGQNIEIPRDALRQTKNNGVKIRRVRHTRFHKASFVGRLINMLTFQLMATWSGLTAPRADAVVVETDPPFLCLLGRAIQLVRGSQLICYLQDIYPDIAVALGKLRPGWIAGILRSAFFRVYRKSDAVVTLSQNMQELLLDGGLLPERVHIIPNWIDTSEIYPVKQDNCFRLEHGFEDRIVVMYNGNLGLSQNLSQVLEAAEFLYDRDDIVVVMVGEGADRMNLERMARDKRIKNVQFLGYQPKTAEVLSAADIHLIILQPKIRQLLMPSKLYGVLASGTAAVVVSDRECELAHIVDENYLGKVVPYNNPKRLADAIVEMADNHSERTCQGFAARRFAEGNCRRDLAVTRFRGLIEGLLHVATDSAKPAVPSGDPFTATATSNG